jgi:hypothetical protein
MEIAELRPAVGATSIPVVQNDVGKVPGSTLSGAMQLTVRLDTPAGFKPTPCNLLISKLATSAQTIDTTLVCQSPAQFWRAQLKP